MNIFAQRKEVRYKRIYKSNVIFIAPYNVVIIELINQASPVSLANKRNLLESRIQMYIGLF